MQGDLYLNKSWACTILYLSIDSLTNNKQISSCSSHKYLSWIGIKPSGVLERQPLSANSIANQHARYKINGTKIYTADNMFKEVDTLANYKKKFPYLSIFIINKKQKRQFLPWSQTYIVQMEGSNIICPQSFWQ